MVIDRRHKEAYNRLKQTESVFERRMHMENMSRAEALSQIGAVLAQLPDSELRDATNHLIGIINGMAIAMGMQKTKDDGAA